MWHDLDDVARFNWPYHVVVTYQLLEGRHVSKHLRLVVSGHWMARQ